MKKNKRSIIQGEQSSIQATVQNDSEDQYLQMWQTCVEMANNSSDKRINASTVYMTINVALLAVLTFSFDVKNILISIIGVSVSVIWMRSISSYKKLNAAKFKVIDELESKLAYAPFKREWEIMGNDKRERRILTRTEAQLPWVFLFLFIVIGVISIPCVSSWLGSLKIVSDFLMISPKQ